MVTVSRFRIDNAKKTSAFRTCYDSVSSCIPAFRIVQIASLALVSGIAAVIILMAPHFKDNEKKGFPAWQAMFSIP